MGHWTETEIHHRACSEALDWCRTHPDFQTAWDKCINPQWMLWHLEYFCPTPPTRV